MSVLRKLSWGPGRVLRGAVVCVLVAGVLIGGSAPTLQPTPAGAQEDGNHSELVSDVVFAIHGGAGTIRREDLTPELEQRYRNA